MRRNTSLGSEQAITSEGLTAILAERVMGWGVGPDRFLMGNRRWMPRWRFRPLDRLSDAIRLLEAAAPERYTMRAEKDCLVTVRVQIAGSTGQACERSKPRAVALAIANALQIPVDGLESQDSVDRISGGAKPSRHQRGDVGA